MSNKESIHRQIKEILELNQSIPVYEAVPNGTKMPYIVVSDMQESKYPCNTAEFKEILLDIYIYSEEKSSKKIVRIGEMIDELMHSSVRKVLSALVMGKMEINLARTKDNLAFEYKITYRIVI